MDAAVTKYLDEHQDQFLEELKTLLQMPSVSAYPAFLPAMKQAAEYVRDHNSSCSRSRHAGDASMSSRYEPATSARAANGLRSKSCITWLATLTLMMRA